MGESIKSMRSGIRRSAVNHQAVVRETSFTVRLKRSPVKAVSDRSKGEKRRRDIKRRLRKERRSGQRAGINGGNRITSISKVLFGGKSASASWPEPMDDARVAGSIRPSRFTIAVIHKIAGLDRTHGLRKRSYLI
jgi:hypothetical protein